jgi:glycerol uptake facilitator-like aquaporin
MMRRLVAEGLGSLLLAATVVGSGIMAERLAAGNTAVALLANTGATVAVLMVLIELFRPVSGAHFNPAVTLAVALRGGMSTGRATQYILLQVAGCCAGAVLANGMFELPPIHISTHARTGIAQWIGEFVATFGLLLIALGYHRARNIAVLVAAWIGAAYWFTSSTSFANPAITIARALSDTFSGIRPFDVAPFVLAQLAGSTCALALSAWLFSARDQEVGETRR